VLILKSCRRCVVMFIMRPAFFTLRKIILFMDTAQEKNTRDFLNVITSYDQYISKRASVCRPPLNIRVED
jgi:hypothetical protein